MNALELIQAAARPALDAGVLRALQDGAMLLSPSWFGVRSTLGLRNLASTSLRARAAVGGSSIDKMAVAGLCVPFDKQGRDMAGQPGSLVCQRGCFARSLSAGDDDPRLLFNLNPSMVLGRKSAGTARFYEGIDGLMFEADPPDTTWADDLLVSMDRGDVNGSAAVFQVLQQRQEERGGQLIRVVTAAQLIAVSITSWPQFDNATATVSKQQIAAGYSPEGRLVQ